MSDEPSLNEWNYQVLMLGQALVGAISPNFRMVSISWQEGVWNIAFYLAEDIEEDMEEIEEIFCQYGAYQTSALRCKSRVILGTDRLPTLSPPERIVYRRREGVL